MVKTILITGTSSGIGRATALYFATGGELVSSSLSVVLAILAAAYIGTH
jgi:NAD(P)-dependent dehydrogenase (short-subunit alcohol dehydrogenase family)